MKANMDSSLDFWKLIHHISEQKWWKKYPCYFTLIYSICVLWMNVPIQPPKEQINVLVINKYFFSGSIRGPAPYAGVLLCFLEDTVVENLGIKVVSLRDKDSQFLYGKFINSNVWETQNYRLDISHFKVSDPVYKELKNNKVEVAYTNHLRTRIQFAFEREKSWKWRMFKLSLLGATIISISLVPLFNWLVNEIKKLESIAD